jgi:putative peptidoglycan lipid II flippase
VGNEGQYLPRPQQGAAEQPPAYYGWQYEQDAYDPVTPPLPAAPSQPLPLAEQRSAPPARAQFRPLSSYGVPSGPLPQPEAGDPGQEQAVPAQYQEPLLDIGSSLGYGQGMEYQYFNAPQPSQPMAVLRQTRFQQLRAERMRRQQSGQRDMTRVMPERGTPPASGLLPPQAADGSAPVGIPWDPLTPAPPAFPAHTQTPALPRTPAGLPLSLPSKPLPAVHVSGSLLQKEDSGSVQRMNMARATMILTGSFVAGRILGLVRTSLFAFVFGTSMTSDAYLQAFLVPDLIFNVIAGGALSSAFIPIFTQYMVGERDEKTAWRIASSAFNLALVMMCLLAVAAMLLAPWLVPLYNPGVGPVETQLIVMLTRIMLVQAVIMGGGVIINSVLYARQNFLLPAVGTVLYNVGLIVGLLPGFLLTFFGRSEAHTTFAVSAAAVGVVLGALLQVGVQLPGVVRERVRYTLSFDWDHPGVRQIGRQMLPRVLNAAMLYFTTFVDRGLILLLAAGPFVLNPQGLVTQYYQALQLMLLPLGIFGMAVSTAAFPTMAENVTLGRLDRVRAIIEDTLRTILFLSIPSSVGLIVLGLPVIQVLLQHGAFNLASATSTSVPLALFALGLAGLASVEILTRSFYAFRDSKTPVLVSVAQFLLKIFLSLILLNLLKWGPSWGLGSLAFATSVAGSLEAVALLWLLQKKIGLLGLRSLARFCGRVLLASLAMGAGVLLLRTLLDLLLITTTSPSLGVLGTIFATFKLAAELLAGLLVYVWATRQFGIEDFWKQGPVRRVLERFKLSWI